MPKRKNQGGGCCCTTVYRCGTCTSIPGTLHATVIYHQCTLGNPTNTLTLTFTWTGVSWVCTVSVPNISRFSIGCSATNPVTFTIKCVSGVLGIITTDAGGAALVNFPSGNLTITSCGGTFAASASISSSLPAYNPVQWTVTG